MLTHRKVGEVRPVPPLVALTVGDLQGIGPEIIAKALSDNQLRRFFRPIVVGQSEILEHAFARWGKGIPIRNVLVPDLQAEANGSVQLWDPALDAPLLDRILPEMVYIRSAAEGCLQGSFAAMVTAPICKEAMYKRGFRFPGHTEYLAHVTGSSHSVMAFAAPGLKVSLVTVHLPLKAVFKTLTPELILTTLRISDQGLRTFFGIKKPRLAICGLNPHAGENGHLGDEEQTILAPALEQARQEGLQVSGPLPADTVFGQAVRGRFDMVVALYHDQGLIPVKLLSFGESVNLTFGLPIVRTSVDHGVAYDIAGQGIADASSMKAAIRLSLEIVAHRLEDSSLR